MSEALWLMAAAALSLAGMAWLALAMEVHWEQAMHRPAAAEGPAVRRSLRTMGAAALSLSLLACLMADRPSMAVLVWVMLLAAGAVAVALLLATRPGVLALFWPMARSARVNTGRKP